MSNNFGVWHKSSYSASPRQDCVEVRETPHQVYLRDSKHPHRAHLNLPTQEWTALLHAIRCNEV